MARSEMSSSTSTKKKYATVHISACTMLPLANPVAVPDVSMKNNGFKKKIIIKTDLSLWNKKRSISVV